MGVAQNKIREKHNISDDHVTVTFENPVDNHMFKVNNRDARTRCKICSKLTIKTPQRRQWRRSGVFIVNFEHISHLLLVFLLLTLNIKFPAENDSQGKYC